MNKNIMSGVLGLVLMFAGTQAYAASLTVIVNTGSGISAMSEKDVQKLFMGKSKKLPNKARAVIVRHEESASDFNKLVLGSSDAKVKSSWSKLIFSGRAKAPVEVASAEEVIEFVKNNPNAVGYVNTDDLPEGISAVFSK